MKKYAVVFLVLLPLCAYAQLRVNAYADSSTILIGNPFTLTVTAQSPVPLQVNPPKWKEVLTGWEILQADSPHLALDAGYSFSQKLRITSWDSGMRYLPPFLFTYKEKGRDTVWQMAQTTPIPIRILTVPVDTTKAFKSIKAPLETTYMWQEGIPYLLGLVLLLLAIGAGWLIKRKGKKVEKTVDTKGLKQIALQRLAEIERADYCSRGEVKMHHARITDVLRVYIEKAWGIPVTDQTTDEILVSLNGKMSAEDFYELNVMLRTADKVKFAKYSPREIENKEILSKAITWIQKR